MTDRISGVGVIDKGVGVLRAIAERGPLSLIELQEATSMPRATAHRLAVALEEHDLIRREPDGRFALGFGLLALGHAASEAFPLAPLARPHLEQLRDATGESVQLYVREGAHRRCVVSLQSPHGLRWIVPEGSLLPLDRGSAGKVFAGGGREGWSQSVEEREAGVASVSAAVLDARRTVVAAVSVSGPVGRLTTEPGNRFGEAVLTTAEAVSASVRAAATLRR